jgi:regulatory protein
MRFHSSRPRTSAHDRPAGEGSGDERSTDLSATREAALRLLDRSRRTRSDLAARLSEKGFADATILEVIERLAGVGLVDDVEYARAFLAGRWGRRAAGWRRLEQELRVRGVSPDDVASARVRLEAATGEVNEVAGARRVVEQSARRYASLEPRVRRQRLWALLSRRGFDRDTIEAALRESAEPVMNESGDPD